MNSRIEEVREDIQDMKKKNKSTNELIIETFDRATKRDRFHTKVLLVIILFLLAIIAYDSYQDANTGWVETTEETSTEQNGTYNFYDSEGNMVSSDLSIEEMKELVDSNGGAE